MSALRIITRTEVSELLASERLRPALEKALVAQSAGQSNVPPRIAAVGEHGLLATMPGALDGVGMAAKLVSVFPGHDPSHQGVIVVVDPDTGTLRSIMDAEVITERRTAMTAAIAADVLARPDAEVLTIVGGGAQGHAHVDAFGGIRPWTQIRVVSRTKNKATVLAAEARFRFGADVTIAEFDDVASAVAGADVVALCTHADTPLIEPSWVDQGTHVSSVGSLTELPSGLLDHHVTVDQIGAVTDAPPAGAIELQSLDPAAVVELGSLLADRSLGRANPEQITVYKSTGHAVQDIAAAHVVLDAAIEAGIGMTIDL